MRMRMMVTKALDGVERLVQALALLGIEGGQCSIGELARKLDMSKSATHRMILTLQQAGFIMRVGRGYELGMSIFDLGARVAVERAVARAAGPELERLTNRFGENTHASVLKGYQVLIAAYCTSWRSVTMGRREGLRLPAYCGSPGKVLLSAIPRDQLEGYIAAERFEPLTEKTITNSHRFLLELQRARDRGFAVSRDESAHGMSSVSVPIVSPGGLWFAAIGMAGPTERLGDGFIEQILPELKAAAAAIGERLFKCGGDQDPLSSGVRSCEGPVDPVVFCTGGEVSMHGEMLRLS